MKYKVILHKEDKGYTVEVPALEGCFTQGKTFQEAIENAKEAIVCYIESLKKDGERIPSDEEFLLNEVEVSFG